MEEVVDFICAAQMARQFDEFFAEPDKKEVISFKSLKEPKTPIKLILNYPSGRLMRQLELSASKS